MQRERQGDIVLVLEGLDDPWMLRVGHHVLRPLQLSQGLDCGNQGSIEDVLTLLEDLLLRQRLILKTLGAGEVGALRRNLSSLLWFR